MIFNGCSILICVFLTITKTFGGTFTVDYTSHSFLKDNKPWQYISGSIHYYRIHPEYWEDRIQRVRALGLNAIQIYVPWNIHEPYEGMYV